MVFGVVLVTTMDQEIVSFRHRFVSALVVMFLRNACAVEIYYNIHVLLFACNKCWFVAYHWNAGKNNTEDRVQRWEILELIEFEHKLSTTILMLRSAKIFFNANFEKRFAMPTPLPPLVFFLHSWTKQVNRTGRAKTTVIAVVALLINRYSFTYFKSL